MSAAREVRSPITRHLSGNLRGWRGSAIVLGVVFRGFRAVKDGLLSVTMRDQRLVRRVRVVLFFVVLRGLMMVSRRLLVMFCCERMVFCACAVLGHDSYAYARCDRSTPAKQTGARLRPQSQIGQLRK